MSSQRFRDLYWMAMVFGMTGACASIDAAEHALALHRAAAQFSGLCIVENSFMFLGSMDHHLGVLAATFGDVSLADAELQAALEVHTGCRRPDGSS